MRLLWLTCSALSIPLLWSAVAKATPPEASAAPTNAQVEVFADIVDDTGDGVRQRLRGDAALGPIIVQASEARDDRKHTGTALIVAGSVVLGVSNLAGTVIVLATPDYPNVGSSGQGQLLLGIGVDIVGIAVGLALAIPGVVKVSAHSDEEKRATDYYGRAKHDEPPSPAPLPSPTIVMSLPIASLAF